MATTTTDSIPVCDGVGEPCNPRVFGRGYFPDIKAKCPACGKWADAKVTSTIGDMRFGVIEPHTPKGYRRPRKAAVTVS